MAGNPVHASACEWKALRPDVEMGQRKLTQRAYSSGYISKFGLTFPCDLLSLMAELTRKGRPDMTLTHLYGTTGSDTILGTDLDEFILDLDGDDLVYGGAGNDMFHNSRGNDRIFGEAGDDEFGFHPKTATLMDPGRKVWIDGGDGDDTVNFYRDDAGFTIRERGDKHIITFRGDDMRVILTDVEHVVFLNEAWDI